MEPPNLLKLKREHMARHGRLHAEAWQCRMAGDTQSSFIRRCTKHFAIPLRPPSHWYYHNQPPARPPTPAPNPPPSQPPRPRPARWSSSRHLPPRPRRRLLASPRSTCGTHIPSPTQTHAPMSHIRSARLVTHVHHPPIIVHLPFSSVHLPHSPSQVPPSFSHPSPSLHQSPFAFTSTSIVSLPPASLLSPSVNRCPPRCPRHPPYLIHRLPPPSSACFSILLALSTSHSPQSTSSLHRLSCVHLPPTASQLPSIT